MGHEEISIVVEKYSKLASRDGNCKNLKSYTFNYCRGSFEILKHDFVEITLESIRRLLIIMLEMRTGRFYYSHT